MSPPSTPVQLPFLDGLRGLAAFYVLIFHARWLMWEGFNEGFVQHPDLYSAPAKLLTYGSLLFYYGHQAVILFFVLSGFVIHLRYAQQAAQETAPFDTRAYFTRRIKRLYPTLLIALGVGGALDLFGLANGLPIYAHQTRYALINDVPFALTPDAFLGTLLLLPETPHWGSNLPIWSLKLEWGFYLLYPFIEWVGRRSLRLTTGIVVGLSALSFLPFESWGSVAKSIESVCALMIVWWGGALLAEVYVGRWRGRFKLGWIGLLSGLLLIAPFTVEPFLKVNEILRDIFWAIGFIGALAALLAWRNRGGTLMPLERLKWLGDISYPLYLLHFPILFLICGFLLRASPTGELPMTFEWVLIGSGVCLVSAVVCHRVVNTIQPKSGAFVQAILAIRVIKLL
jgi:peptidoglycan/LPS O-acetylase OafA/YrhL